MWHKNNPDAPKPKGQVLVRDKFGVLEVAEWAGRCWSLWDGEWSWAEFTVEFWHEIPPFEEPQE